MDIDRNDRTSDLNEMRSLLDDMVTLKRRNEFPWKFDKHLWPQMLFVIDKYGAVLDFNYIGMMENINVTLPPLLEQYESVPPSVVQEFLRENIHRDSRSRKYDDTYASYDGYVTRDDLGLREQEMIREVYWLDYQCLFPDL